MSGAFTEPGSAFQGCSDSGQIGQTRIGKLWSKRSDLKQQRRISKIVRCVEPDLGRPCPQISSCGSERNRNVRKRYWIERRKNCFVLTCGDLEILIGELKICETKPGLIENHSLRQVRVDGPSTEEIKFQLR